ncbi:4-(cytidine 5'-diphospho)-2-C-methyl-D-erythritol kinase [Persicirhabdus sediminis]|uniref:4-diphosphocytidyl-2-C-methyl-D-erythritol kinase n=1 Tax=Persicirhabdus sediminis TaxID=454144 RepID=A0A8J7SN81_9BACT|nr:4-(cytidine 5'-diphospho)-2-C-methyl-D-erythritol kinase [Persicirhabdus sediminis]MBK1791538.1 4-(cytidine 5'-diphospho)-2-C-methyl-D-erythritol kinase [Persicirhabdus sediminis]
MKVELNQLADGSYHIFAPAKINLSLRILRKRDDGFHELETVMAPLAFGDRLKISPADSYQLECSDPTVPTGEDNLVTMAVRAFQQKTGAPCNWRIQLEKQTPHGAGLGGGSSDAASAVLALNQLENTQLSEGEMAELVGQFGSDTSFFIYRSHALCRGRGEQVEPVAAGQPVAVLLLKPNFPVSTPDAYKRWQGSRELDGVPYGAQSFGGYQLVNDLERPVFEKHLFLAQVKLWLLEQDEVGAAMMSGSGSTMLAFLHDGADGEALAKRACEQLDPYMWSLVTEVVV